MLVVALLRNRLLRDDLQNLLDLIHRLVVARVKAQRDIELGDVIMREHSTTNSSAHVGK